MKQIFYLILAGCSLSLGNVNANPGDTTWVQSHTDVQMTSYGAFDAPIAFPSGTTAYRRIFMIFELGKYQCPAGSSYCFDWDYDVSTLLMPASGDTLELGRLITPYANHTQGARMALNWKGKYVFDVTDFYPVLKNNAAIRVNFYGYSYGFTTTVKFAFIEGTPERNVAGIHKVWSGSYDYGHGSTPINTALGNVSLTAPAGTVSAESKFLITGHGGDGSANAAEFYPNSYTMNLNNNPLVTQSIWRDNCGFNNYYPQNGTWVYDRASWCPGDLVYPYSHVLTGITANSNYTINATFPAYTSVPSSSGSQAIYKIQNLIFYYGAINKTTDASLEDVIAPTNNEAHFRENPFVGKPKVLVRNSGGNAITSIRFEYGVDGQTLQQYTWTGNINSLENAEITLAECTALNSAAGSNNKFVVNILEVNGQADQDAANDHLVSYFNAAPNNWPATFKIEMKTNKQVFNGVSENNWKIYDVNDNLVAERSNNAISTTYIDTVRLAGGAYKLVVEDAGCDGMNWWVFAYYTPPPGAASIRITPVGSNIAFPLNGYFNGDFGCGFTQYFYADPTTSAADVKAVEKALNIYPNPAGDNVTISVDGIGGNFSGRLKITDAIGKVVYNEKTARVVNTINTSGFPNGFYMVSFEDEKSKTVFQSKLVIMK